MAWIIWLIAAIVLGIAELFTVTFVMLMLAGGAVAAALAALLGAPIEIQTVVFAAVSALGVFVVRPWAKKLRESQTSAERDFGVDALEGAPAKVLEKVDNQHGLVQVSGQEWTARSFDGIQVLEPGEEVNVVEIRGATAMVWRQ